MLGESQDRGRISHPVHAGRIPGLGGWVLATLCMLGESGHLEGLLRMRGHRLSAASSGQVHLSPVDLLL